MKWVTSPSDLHSHEFTFSYENIYVGVSILIFILTTESHWMYHGSQRHMFLTRANQNIKFFCAVPSFLFTLQLLLLRRVSQDIGCFSTLIFDEESVRWQESTFEDAYQSVHSLRDYYLCCLSFGFCLLQKELLWLYAKRP